VADRPVPASREPGAIEEGIEVTPEMIEAGCDVIRDWNPDWTDTAFGRVQQAVSELYKAMEQARRGGLGRGDGAA
jgi:hypothetical protein